MFQLLDGILLIPWQHYCCGDADKQLNPINSPDTNRKKRFSEYMGLMGKIHKNNFSKIMHGLITQPFTMLTTCS